MDVPEVPPGPGRPQEHGDHQDDRQPDHVDEYDDNPRHVASIKRGEKGLPITGTLMRASAVAPVLAASRPVRMATVIPSHGAPIPSSTGSKFTVAPVVSQANSPLATAGPPDSPMSCSANSSDSGSAAATGLLYRLLLTLIEAAATMTVTGPQAIRATRQARGDASWLRDEEVCFPARHERARTGTDRVV